MAPLHDGFRAPPGRDVGLKVTTTICCLLRSFYIMEIKIKLNSMAHRGRRTTVPISVCMTLGTEVHEQMFLSGGQSDAKPPMFSSQASLVLIYRLTAKLEFLTFTEIISLYRYHCSRRKQKPTSDINKALTGGAQRSSLNQSPGDQSRRFSTADSHWLGTRACAVLAISLRCQSMFRYFTARLEILTLKLGEWGATSVVLLVTQLKFQISRL
ncbi:uncharacterized protein TNCV_1220101 [Trichonephila clavipes]|nr:uncharacterized protein TNCV_1220101 [Trichonephila clavipes]